MNRMRRSASTALVVALLSLVAAAVPVLAQQRAAPALPPVVVSVFSDAGDYVGDGVAQEFDVTNATFTGSLKTTGVSLSIDTGTFDFDVDPGKGKILRTGTFTELAQESSYPPGQPTFTIGGDGHGCDTQTGSVDIRDLASKGTALTRLDLTYVQYCEGAGAALYGELRIGEPDSTAPVITSSAIAWPPSELRARTSVASIWVRNPGTAPLPVGQVALGGAAAKSFAVISDGCSNRTLPATGACQLFLVFRGVTPGPATAALAIPVAGVAHSVQLDGDVSAGSTALKMVSQPGDPVGAGTRYDYTAAKDVLTFTATPTDLQLDVSIPGGGFWDVEMLPAKGRVLSPGGYYRLGGYPDSTGPGNGLGIYGPSGACPSTVTGAFRVQQVDFAADGSLQHFAATFRQRCIGATGALTGSVSYAAEAVTTPPPGVSALTATTSGTDTTVRWTDPPAGTAYTVVRLEEGTPDGVSPEGGIAVYQGRATTATVSGLAPGHSYTATAFTVDKYGNVSAPVSVAIT